MTPCEHCTCQGGGCTNGEKAKPRPARLPWLSLVLLAMLGAAVLFAQAFGKSETVAEAPVPPQTTQQNTGETDMPDFDKIYNYVKPTEEELAERLTDLQFAVTQENATERPFTNEYDKHFEPGIYVDITSGQPLFVSADKYDSGCGWPAFSKPITDDLIVEVADHTLSRVRTEVRSALGDAHLGHVFDDGPAELGGLRYCINSASLRFVPRAEMAEQGYGYLLPLVPEGGQ